MTSETWESTFGDGRTVALENFVRLEVAIQDVEPHEWVLAAE